MILSRVVSCALLALAVQSSAVAGAGEMQQTGIEDPVLQMTAWNLVIPAGWTAVGTMLPGSSCNNATTPTYRATSPDGRMGAYFLPRSDWVWGAGVRPSNDCMPWARVVSAREFLSDFVRIRGLHVVGEEPVPELANLRATFEGTADMARFRVSYSVNGRPTEEVVGTTVTCTQFSTMGVGQQHSCSATVKRWFAPAGRLDEAIPMFKAMRLSLNQQWMQQWTAAMTSRTNTLYQGQTRTLLEQGRLAQAERTQEHRDFMASEQQRAAARTGNFERQQYAKQRNKEDYVDFILDCQRLYDGGTRVSVGYNCPNRQTR